MHQRNWAPYAAAAAAALVAIALTWALTLNHCGYNNCLRIEAERVPAPSRAPIDPGESTTTTTWVQVGLNVLSLLGLGLTVWFAGRTLVLQRRAYVADLRAYLKVKVIHATIVTGEPVQVIVSPRNYGRSPAFAVSVNSSLIIRNSEWDWEDDGLPPLHVDPRTIDIHPGDEMQVPVRVIDDEGQPIKLLSALHERILKGESKLHLRVLMDYRDAFRVLRQTEVRYEVAAKAKGESTTGKLTLSRAT